MKRYPSIGITVSWAPPKEGRAGFPDPGFDFIKNEYVEAVAESGGVPLLIPNLDRPHWALLDQMLPRLDGLLFSGGSDLAPDLFGQEENPEAGCNIRRRRDVFELELLRRWNMIRPDGPIFGICRGHQVLNVFYGGDLFQDFGAYGREVIPQGHLSPEKKRTHHKIDVKDGSMLEGIIGGGDHEVNSSHHQGIKILADDFLASAYAPDGIIEAFELREQSRWLMSVQWHPEAMFDTVESRKLFKAFIEACSIPPSSPGRHG